MKAHYLLLLTFALLPFVALAELIELPNCTLSVTEISGDPSYLPLLMVNGIPTSSLIFTPLIAELGKRNLPNPIIRLDLPGTGNSRMHRPDYTWTTQRECLRAFLKYTGPVIPVIHDVAGPIMLPLLKSSDIPAFVLFDTIVKPSAFTPRFPMSLAQIKGFGPTAVDAIPFAVFAMMYGAEGFGRPEKVCADLLMGLYRSMRGDQVFRNMSAFELDAGTDRLILAGLNENLPHLVLWGQRDKMIGAQFSYLPNAYRRAARVFPEGKHFLMIDFAAEVAEELTSWLQAHSYFLQ